MFVHVASESEREALRRVFGPGVDSATFWDAEYACDGFELVVAYDAAGAEIGRAAPDVPDDADAWDQLGGIPSGRGLTVKFGLQII